MNKRMKLKEVKHLVKGHIASKWQIGNFLSPKPLSIFLKYSGVRAKISYFCMKIYQYFIFHL